MIDHEAVTPALQQSAKTMFGASAFPGVRLSFDFLDFSFVFFSFVSFRISVFLAATLTASWRTPALGRLPRLLKPSWLGLVPEAAPTRAPAGTPGLASPPSSTSLDMLSAMGTAGIAANVEAPGRSFFCVYLVALMLSKRTVAQNQSRNRKAARTFLEPWVAQTVSGQERVRAFRKQFAGVVRQLLRRTLEQGASSERLDRVLAALMAQAPADAEAGGRP